MVLVQIRWAPQTMCGTIGTSAAIAIRGRAVLNSFEFEAAADRRLRVHPDEFAVLQRLHGGVERGGAAGAVHRDVAHPAHERAADAVVEDLPAWLGETHQTAWVREVRGQTGEGEVEVAGVIDRHDGAARGGQVLHPGDREAQALDPPEQPGSRIAPPYTGSTESTLPVGG